MEGEPLPTRSYNHIAFKVRSEHLPEYRRAIDRLGLEMREARPRVEGEGHSIYFYDFDNHLFELHTERSKSALPAMRREGPPENSLRGASPIPRRTYPPVDPGPNRPAIGWRQAPLAVMIASFEAPRLRQSPP
jgi:hypothetical protein